MAEEPIDKDDPEERADATLDAWWPHFILGRDHAGPGSNSKGIDFYGPYEARDYAQAFSEEVGIETCDFEMMVYLENEGCFRSESEVADGHPGVKKLSGTEVRRRLNTGEEIPPWFSHPRVVSILREANPPTHKQGAVLFFTGLSGSGKSTIAQALHTRLLETGAGGRRLTMLDGDHVRQELSAGLGFSREDRDRNIRRIGYVAAEVARHSGFAICAAIAPFEAARRQARELVDPTTSRFIEIFVDTPLEECEERDRKGLYAKARKGIIKGMTGIDDPYETPQNPEIRISSVSIDGAVDQIIDYLYGTGLLRSDKEDAETPRN